MNTDLVIPFLNAVVTSVISALGVSTVIAIFLIFGVIAAKVINLIIKGILQQAKVEEKIKKMGLERALFGFTVTGILTKLIDAYIILLSLILATSVVNNIIMVQLAMALLAYLSTLTQGIVLLVAVLFIATYVGNIIETSNRTFSHQISKIVKFIIIYIGIIITLPLVFPNVRGTVDILSNILVLFLSAISIAFAIAVGIALGLGLKEPIEKAAAKNQDLFDNLFKSIRKK
ncbi:MAG: hypothetical protein N3D73_02160 [Candidatus Diapherotrites archaeon]|nr:hypothetical protein [Candidatus Diapherotrites archaeon]